MFIKFSTFILDYLTKYLTLLLYNFFKVQTIPFQNEFNREIDERNERKLKLYACWINPPFRFLD